MAHIQTTIKPKLCHCGRAKTFTATRPHWFGIRPIVQIFLKDTKMKEKRLKNYFFSMSKNIFCAKNLKRFPRNSVHFNKNKIAVLLFFEGLLPCREFSFQLSLTDQAPATFYRLVEAKATTDLLSPRLVESRLRQRIFFLLCKVAAVANVVVVAVVAVVVVRHISAKNPFSCSDLRSCIKTHDRTHD